MQVLIPIRQMMNLQGLEQSDRRPPDCVSIVGTTTIVRQSGAMPEE